MQHEELTFKQKFLKNFSNFLAGKWKIIVLTITAIFVFVIAAAVYAEIRSSINEKSTMQIEEIEERYLTIIQDESIADKTEKIAEITASLDEIISKYSRYYAGQRALFMKSDILFDDKQFDKAIESYILFSNKYKDSYLTPIALNNAAVAYEETDKTDMALENYKKIASEFENEYPDLPHVLFSIGRLSESREDYQTASDFYRKLIDNYTNSDWTNFARNRIIYLKAAGKINT
jgi:predicted negative regulator of RcsB-dependent stress response